MIENIGFKNFRRFEDFPNMELGLINLFIGKNNSGKSTVIKGLRLLGENLHFPGCSYENNNIKLPLFRFDLFFRGEVGFGNFQRNLYAEAKRKEIMLSCTINNYYYEIVIDGSDEEHNSSLILPISSARIAGSFYDFTFDYKSKVIHCALYATKENKKKIIDSYQEKIDKLSLEKQSLKNKEYTKKSNDSFVDDPAIKDIELIDYQINKFNTSIAIISDLTDEVKLFDINVNKYLNRFAFNEYEEGFSQIIDFVLQFSNFDFSSSQLSENIVDLSADYSSVSTYQRYIQSFESILDIDKEKILNPVCNIRFSGAQSAVQDVLVRKRDLNSLALAVDVASQRPHHTGDRINDFILRWIKEFEIGTDFKIDNIENEFYMIKIFDGTNWRSLADLGKGSVQLFTLIMDIASDLTGEYNIYGSSQSNNIIIVEEPEQNLHPLLQSKLADFFLDAQKMSKNDCQTRTGLQIFVETHSEYLVRRTQVLVANEKYVNKKDMADNNPFNILYFDSNSKEEPSYKMEYEITGGFIRTFGPGFFDVAADLDMEIIQNEITVAEKLNKESDIDGLLNLIK